MSRSKKVCIVISVVVAVVLIVAAALIGTSFWKINSDEAGISYDTYNMKLSESVQLEGLYTGVPGFKFIIFPNVYTTMTFPSLHCLNKDGVTIGLDVSYQYKARLENLRDIILQFQDFIGYKKMLNRTGSAAIHEACSKFDTSQVQAERGAFQETVRRKLRERYDLLNCDITDLQVNNIQRPEEYETVIRSKERAREDIQVALQERPRRLTEAETEKKQAVTQAEIIIDKAMSQARILENSGNIEAEAILASYQKESEAYSDILDVSGLGFTTEGFISYLGVRVVSSAKNPVFISLPSPAKASYSIP